MRPRTLCGFRGPSIQGVKAKLGRVSGAGQADIRRLLIIAAMARVNWTSRKPSTCFARVLEKKPPMLVSIAFANKVARDIWAMRVRYEDYSDPSLSVMLRAGINRDSLGALREL